MIQETDILVLGSGPGGYTAAFRAADLNKKTGKKVTLVEKFSQLGGVCLNVGCIPSKSLLHTASVLEEASHAEAYGIDFGTPKIDLSKIRESKESVVKKLTGGLQFLAKQRKVNVVQGEGIFIDANHLQVTNEKGEASTIRFEQAIIAAGSSPIKLPSLPDDPRIMTSTGALKLEEIPQKLLIIGGGIIGLEMATVYHALGSKVTVVELGDQLIPAADADVVKPLHKKLSAQYEILLNTKVSGVRAEKEGLYVQFEGANAPEGEPMYDRILCAVGRTPNSGSIGADALELNIDSKGFIQVDDQMRTNISNIFAIGDIVGQPMLAHKASAEAKIAAEVASGESHTFVATCIPSVAYTNPELAWVGLTEKEATAQGIAYKKGVFPWSASGRALTQGATEGMTKLLFDRETQAIIGGGVVGAHASELVGEITTLIEMGATVEDIILMIHPHPTLSETVLFAAEMAAGTITDLLPPKE